MNKERKEELHDVTSLLDEASDRLQEIICDEQDAFDELNEGLQNSRTGESMLNAIDVMEGFCGDITAISERIENYVKPKRKKKI